MNTAFILVSLSYIALVVFVMWMLFIKRLKTLHIIAICLLLPLIYFLHWQSLQNTKGWPTDQTLPTQFELISADIIEPNQAHEIRGNIHLWIRSSEQEPPRAYMLNYSRELHERLFEAKKRMQSGRRQIGMLYDTSDASQTGASVGGGMKLRFRNAPRKTLPRKK